MTAPKALAIVIVGVIVFAMIGGLTGAVIGNVAPGYYRAVFRQGRHPDFRPLEVGIGLGVTQGMGAGLAISLALVALLVWKDYRRLHPTSSPPVNEPGPHGLRSWAIVLIGGVLAILTIAFFSAIAFVGGAVIGEGGERRRTAERKMDKIQTILNVGGYSQLKSDYWSDGQVYVTGRLPTVEARTALHKKLESAFGTDDAAEMIKPVEVDP